MFGNVRLTCGDGRVRWDESDSKSKMWKKEEERVAMSQERVKPSWRSQEEVVSLAPEA